MAKLGPDQIRALRADSPKTRARDFAEAHGIAEADLVAAQVGHGATAIDAHPDRLIPFVRDLGDVLALTRNDNCVHERRGVYNDYHGGGHAAMVLDPEIDLRLFPAQWVHGFALSEQGADGKVKRSLQVFDAAGDAVHKIFLGPASDVVAFDRLVAALRRPEQAASLDLSSRKPVEAAREAPERADALRAEWSRMTDTHQFLRVAREQKMNRLGAYRVVGAPHARPLAPEAVMQCLNAAAVGRIPVMIFVGNMGCIQIHGGPIERIETVGPWFNVLDPRFNLHLRADRIAEVWLVAKPVSGGDAVSVEAFDGRGELILQIFGNRRAGPLEAWDALAETLPRREEVPA